MSYQIHRQAGTSDKRVGQNAKTLASRIIQRIRSALVGRIIKEQGKSPERMVGNDNDKEALRREFGSDIELDEGEAAAGLVDTGSEHGWHKPPRDQGPIPGGLVCALPFGNSEDAESHVQEAYRADRETGCITSW